MFVGYIYSSIVAALLSLVFVWYAGYGIVDKIRKELKKDVAETIYSQADNKFSDRTNVWDLCFAEPADEYSEPEYFSQTAILRFREPYIPIKKIHKSNNFLRPPPID